MGGVLVLNARADIALVAVHPTVAQVGQVVEVRAGAYKSFAPMPLYLVPHAQAPRPYPCGPKRNDTRRVVFCTPVARRAPRKHPFLFVGRLDFRHPRDVRLAVRVPRVALGVYDFVIYCDPCNRGEGGTLVTSSSPSLRVMG
jgi:hypothetical protein